MYGTVIHKACECTWKQIWSWGNGTQVGIQEVILLRFDTLQGDKILCSCAVKITHTEAWSSLIEYVLTRDKILVT